MFAVTVDSASHGWPPRGKFARAALVLLLQLFCALFPVRSVAAATSSERAELRPCTAPAELWLASTRSGDCDDPPKFWRCHDEQGWTRATLEDFEVAAPDLPTCVWIHGNRTTFGESKRLGRILLGNLRDYDPGRGIRFVIWSWPADKAPTGPLEDLRIKAERSDREGLRLASFLRRWRPHGKVSLLGYSYGARIITGALDDLADDSSMVTNSGARHPARTAVLMAPALHSCWLLPGYRHGDAVSQVDGMLIMKNPCDRALEWYPLVAYGRRPTGPQALGYTGLRSVGRLGEEATKVEQFNVTRIVGSEHEVMLYITESSILERVAPFVYDPPMSGHDQ